MVQDQWPQRKLERVQNLAAFSQQHCLPAGSFDTLDNRIWYKRIFLGGGGAGAGAGNPLW